MPSCLLALDSMYVKILDARGTPPPPFSLLLTKFVEIEDAQQGTTSLCYPADCPWVSSIASTLWITGILYIYCILHAGIGYLVCYQYAIPAMLSLPILYGHFFGHSAACVSRIRHLVPVSPKFCIWYPGTGIYLV